MTHTSIPTHRERARQGFYMNLDYYNQVTLQSRYIQLHPGDTHSKWGEIIDAWDAGIKVHVTRVVRNLSTSGFTPAVGDIIFIPWNKCNYAHCTQETAQDRSVLGYNDNDKFTWAEFCRR